MGNVFFEYIYFTNTMTQRKALLNIRKQEVYLLKRMTKENLRTNLNLFKKKLTRPLCLQYS